MTPLDLVKDAYAKMHAEKDAEIATPTESLKAKVEAVVQQQMGDQIAPIKSINDLVKTAAGGDDEIIGDRFLCRAGGLLFPAPTGIGKSTFVIQSLCLAALGRESYGLRWTRPTRTLYVQAENDDSDLAGMRDGIYEAAGFSEDEVKQIGDNILVLTESNRTGVHLINYLRDVVDEYRPDMLILDPIFSYLGGNASEQAAVSMFLRNMLNPLLLDYKLGCWLVHHTNKPATGVEKREWQGGEFAYLGAGSAEWANWARATLTIRQIGLDDIFELRAGKRGGRLKWQNPDGERTNHRYIAHAKGSICWQEADYDHVQSLLEGSKKPGRPRKEIDWGKISSLTEYPFVSKIGAIMAVAALAKCSDRTASSMVDQHMINTGEGRNSQWILK